MNIEQLKAKIIYDGSGFTFVYNVKMSGMKPTVKDSVFVFNAWYGDKNKDFNNIDDLMTDRFYW